MYQTIPRIIFVLTVTFGLMACASTSLFEQKLIDEGATRLNGEQAREYLSGNTQQWTEGGAYFHPGGMADIKWQGKTYPAQTWNVRDDGSVCLSNTEGFVTSCSAYFDKDGEVWVVILEVMGEAQQTEGGPDTILEGNQLAEI